MPSYRVLIHRDMVYEMPNAEDARQQAVEDLMTNLRESPGTNDDVVDTAGPFRECEGVTALETED